METTRRLAYFKWPAMTLKLLFLISGLFQLTLADSCSHWPNSHLHKKYCYKFFEILSTYGNAQQTCLSEYSRLVYNPTKDVQIFIVHLLNQQPHAKHEWWLDGQQFLKPRSPCSHLCDYIINANGNHDHSEKNFICQLYAGNPCIGSFSDSHMYKRDCFRLFRNHTNWTNAKSSCESFEGHLADLHQHDTFENIKNYLANTLKGISSYEVLLGAKNADPKYGDFRWIVSNQPLNLSWISNNIKTSGLEKYLSLKKYPSSPLSLSFVADDVFVNYLCQKSAINTTYLLALPPDHETTNTSTMVAVTTGAPGITFVYISTTLTDGQIDIEERWVSMDKADLYKAKNLSSMTAVIIQATQDITVILRRQTGMNYMDSLVLPMTALTTTYHVYSSHTDKVFVAALKHSTKLTAKIINGSLSLSSSFNDTSQKNLHYQEMIIEQMKVVVLSLNLQNDDDVLQLTADGPIAVYSSYDHLVGNELCPSFLYYMSMPDYSKGTEYFTFRTLFKDSSVCNNVELLADEDQMMLNIYGPRNFTRPVNTNNNFNRLSLENQIFHYINGEANKKFIAKKCCLHLIDSCVTPLIPSQHWRSRYDVQTLEHSSNTYIHIVSQSNSTFVDDIGETNKSEQLVTNCSAIYGPTYYGCFAIVKKGIHHIRSSDRTVKFAAYMQFMNPSGAASCHPLGIHTSNMNYQVVALFGSYSMLPSSVAAISTVQTIDPTKQSAGHTNLVPFLTEGPSSTSSSFNSFNVCDSLSTTASTMIKNLITNQILTFMSVPSTSLKQQPISVVTSYPDFSPSLAPSYQILSLASNTQHEISLYYQSTSLTSSTKHETSPTYQGTSVAVMSTVQTSIDPTKQSAGHTNLAPFLTEGPSSTSSSFNSFNVCDSLSITASTMIKNLITNQILTFMSVPFTTLTQQPISVVTSYPDFSSSLAPSYQILSITANTKHQTSPTYQGTSLTTNTKHETSFLESSTSFHQYHVTSLHPTQTTTKASPSIDPATPPTAFLKSPDTKKVPNLCPCFGNTALRAKALSLDTTAAKNSMQERLRINKSQISSFVRVKASSPDSREHVAIIGAIGIITVSCFFSLFLLPDFIAFFGWLIQIISKLFGNPRK